MSDTPSARSAGRGPRTLQLEIAPRLWKLLEEEARREGVDIHSYAREALISRISYDRGFRERRPDLGSKDGATISRFDSVRLRKRSKTGLGR